MLAYIGPQMRHAAADALRTLKGVLGGLAAAATVIALVYAGQLEALENWSLRKLFEARGPREPITPVVIVTIDESSIDELAQWPFARAKHGELVLKLMEGQPLA